MSSFKRMTRTDLMRNYPAKAAVNEQTLSIAREAVAGLWRDRCKERGLLPSEDRSGSCKFSALIAREIFGGRLAGNDEHVFIVVDGTIIDLNQDQVDVKALGSGAYVQDLVGLRHPDYLDALGSCVPRASKWAKVALAEILSGHHALTPKKSLCEVTFSP